MIGTAEQLRNLIVDRFDVRPDRVLPDSDLVSDLGVTSLELVDLVMAIEETWDVTFDDADIDAIRTFSDAVALVEAKRRTRLQ